MTSDKWQVTSDKWRVTSDKWPSAGASLQLVPMIMELIAPVKSQRLYLIVGTSCKLAPAEARTYDYRACSSRREPKALLNSRHELQARASRGINDKWLMTNL